jgi:hypothetical protein
LIIIYINFMIGIFYRGLSAGEMSVLKQCNANFKHRIIKIVEPRLEGEKGREIVYIEIVNI